MMTPIIDTLSRGQSGVGSFPVAIQEDLKISFLTVADLSARNNIPVWKRNAYMTVYVVSTNLEYTLGTDLTLVGQTWTQKTYGVPANIVTRPDIFDGNGFIQPGLIQNIFLNTQYVVSSQAAMLALTTFTGNFIIRTDTGNVYIKLNNTNPAALGDFALATPTASVISVNGQSGIVEVGVTNMLARGTNLADFATAVAATTAVINNSSAITALQAASTATNAAVSALSTFSSTHLGQGLLDSPVQNPTITENNKVLTWNNATLRYELRTPASGGGGVTTFTALTDVPSSYVGQTLKAVRVNAAETALEFYTASSGGWQVIGTTTLTGDATIVGVNKGVIFQNYSTTNGYSISLNPTVTPFGTGQYILGVTPNATSTFGSSTGSYSLFFGNDITASANNSIHTLLGFSGKGLSGGFTGTKWVGIDYNVGIPTTATHYAMLLRTGLVGIGTATPTALLEITQSVSTTGNPIITTITGAAHTTLTSGETIDVNYNLARTVQFSTGAIATQRAFLIQAPTYGFVGASTITTAATFAITGNPILGTNATFTNPAALWVQSGSVLIGTSAYFLGAVNDVMDLRRDQNNTTAVVLGNATSGTIANAGIGVTASATAATSVFLRVFSAGFTSTGITIANTAVVQSSMASGLNIGTTNGAGLGFWTNNISRQSIDTNGLQTYTQSAQAGSNTFITYTQAIHTGGTPILSLWTGGAHTGLTAAETTDINYNLSRTVQFTGSTGFATQRAFRIQAPTYGFVSATGTIATASTLSITGAPVAGTNAIITNAWALNIESGNTFFGGKAVFTQTTTTAPINLGGFATDPSNHTEGDLAYNLTSHVLNFWNGTAWTSTGGGGGSWLLASGGLLTGVNTITSNAVNQLIFAGTFTAGAATDSVASFGGTLTAASGLGVQGYVFNPSMAASGTSSLQIAVNISPTFSGGTTPVNVPLQVRVDQNAQTIIQFINNTSGTGATVNFAISNGSNALSLLAFSAGFSTSGMNIANTNAVQSNGKPLNIGTSSSGGAVGFWSNNALGATLTTSVQWLVGYTVAAGTELMGVQKNQNATTRLSVTNTTSGTAGASQMAVSVSSTIATGLFLSSLSALFSTSGMFVQNTNTISTTGQLGLNVGTSDAQQLSLWSNGIKRLGFDSNGLGVFTNSVQTSGNNQFITFTQAAQTTAGTAPGLLWTGGAHLAMTLSTEVIDINYNLARTVQFATGALTTQRAFVIQGPTYGFVGASTITDAATLAITASPGVGSNATITNSHGLLIQTNGLSGTITNSYGLTVNAQQTGSNATSAWSAQFLGGAGVKFSQTTINAQNTFISMTQSAHTAGQPFGFLFTGGAHTSMQVGSEVSDIVWNLAQTKQWNSNTLLATQRSFLIQAPTYSSNTAGFVITDAATFAITGAPIQSTNTVITNAWAILIQAGNTKSFGKIVFDVTDITTGTTGAQTINKPSGSVNFAAAATTLVVTNSLATLTSHILVSVETVDTTAKSCAVTRAAGSFTLTLNAAATAETRVSFVVFN